MAAILVGRLWLRQRRGRETASFAYDEGWLTNPSDFRLNPLSPSAPANTIPRSIKRSSERSAIPRPTAGAGI